MKAIKIILLSLLVIPSAWAQQDALQFKQFSNEILWNGKCYSDLKELCKGIGNRLSGSAAASKAVAWGLNKMKAAGADTAYLQPVLVPHWVRGKEQLQLEFATNKFETVPMLSLGNSQGTNGKLLHAKIIMVRNFAEFEQLDSNLIKGAIIFFNYKFKQDLVNTFEGYGDAGQYRWKSPSMASEKHAAAVIIRSISTGADDYPHTGAMGYRNAKAIPAIAIGNETADRLEKELAKRSVEAKLISNCKMVDTVLSYNVIGELKGSTYPKQIITFGGHLDSWDVGEGAHDDGAGCVQSIEVIRTLKQQHIKPIHTIRAVLFMNEENGLRGGNAYADSLVARKEQAIFAMESDAGGFSPRGIGFEMNDSLKAICKSWKPLFEPYNIYDFDKEEGGADISPLKKLTTPLAGLLPDPQRYFDLHHTNKDVFEEVSHRELKLGAFAMTAFIYMVDQHLFK